MPPDVSFWLASAFILDLDSFVAIRRVQCLLIVADAGTVAPADPAHINCVCDENPASGTRSG
jgi:hypothetical protein